MDERAERFIEMSALLTGFDRVQLLGTGMTDSYLRTLEDAVPAGTLDELLGAYERLPGGTDREAAVASQILGHPKLGSVARNLIVLWYCGTWTALPDAWQAVPGTSAADTSRVVSAEAYRAGLQWIVAGAHPAGRAGRQWIVAGAHPAGARQQGYGAWAVPPEEVREEGGADERR